MIDTAQEIGLEPEQGQKLFAELTESVGTMITSRQQMVAAHTRATAIRMRTNQAARSEGCWPWPLGSAEQESPVALRSVG